MKTKKEVILKYFGSLFICSLMAVSSVLVCKHTPVKDEEVFENLAMQEKPWISPPNFMNAYSSKAIKQDTKETNDIFVKVMCIEGSKWLIVSRKVGTSIAIDSEQIKGLDNFPIKCK